jgi:hypothetical protein
MPVEKAEVLYRRKAGIQFKWKWSTLHCKGKAEVRCKWKATARCRTAGILYSAGGRLRHRREKGRRNRRSVSALSAGAYTTTLLVMVNIGKGGGLARPTLTRLG